MIFPMIFSQVKKPLKVAFNFDFISHIFAIMIIQDAERRNGAIIFHILGAIYFFVLLAILCNDYFLPSVECFCEDLNISKVGEMTLVTFTIYEFIVITIICVGCGCSDYNGSFNNSTRVFCKCDFIICS